MLEVNRKKFSKISGRVNASEDALRGSVTYALQLA